MLKFLKDFSSEQLVNYTIEQIHYTILNTTERADAERRLGIVANSIQLKLYNDLKTINKRAAEIRFKDKYQAILSFIKLPINENRNFSKQVKFGIKIYRTCDFVLEEQGREDLIVSAMNKKAQLMGIEKDVFFLYPRYDTSGYSIFIAEVDYLSWKNGSTRPKFAFPKYSLFNHKILQKFTSEKVTQGRLGNSRMDRQESISLQQFLDGVELPNNSKPVDAQGNKLK